MLKRGRKRVLLIVILLLMLIITGLVIQNNYLMLKRNHQEEMKNEFMLMVSDFKGNVDRTMSYIYGLRGYVYSQIDQGISQESFDAFAEKTQDYAYYIKNFSVAPDNVQTYVYPIEGNEMTLGHKLDEDERTQVRQDVSKAEHTGKIVISGPYLLRQGGLGMVVRNPIFNDKNYWGLVNVVVDLETIIQDSDISDVTGFTYYLANEEGVFWGEMAEQTLTHTFEVGEENWTIGVCYDEDIQFNHLMILIRESLLLILVMLGIMILVARIFSRNMMLSSRIRALIYQDILTSLPNRRALEEHLDQLIEKKIPFTLAFIDLDNFKDINDSLGHSYGDQLLIQIGKRVRRNGPITAYRWGGDEFILVSNQDADTFLSSIQDIQRHISYPVMLSNDEYIITCSAGICSYPKDGQSREEIVKLADTTMYFAKNKGKNTAYIYDTSIGEKLFEDFRIERRLDYAIKNHLLEIHYQPQFNMKKNCIDIVEALARLKDEDGQPISPGKFIPIAEKSHLIYALDEYVFEKVFRDLSNWCEEGHPIKVAINISAKHFSKKFSNFIKDQIVKYNIEPSLVEIEITETVAIEDLDMAVNFIASLNEVGVQIALDDFGIGYSSLSYISILKLSSLKIDRSFINKIEEGNNEYNIIKSVINIVDGLGITSVAEGVENHEQLDLIRDLGCDRYQGYLLSRALPRDEVMSFIQKQNAGSLN